MNKLDFARMVLATMASHLCISDSMRAYREPYDYSSDKVKFSSNSDILFKEPHRELKEFSIQGNKVMAFSRKDAITKLKAMKKLKRKK